MYEVAGALALPELATVQYLAQALGSAPAAVTPNRRSRRGQDHPRRHLERQIARCRLREPDAGTPWCPQVAVAVRVTAADLISPHD
ncbi:hypothetical protein ACIA8F_34950 [Streptomyces sp. NPDC051563]|uniref:hypothetical protein n=1 Tax=Streptomyces sp. NPDC051563 TaxID=3365659 RepID=UPI0037BB7854